MQIKDQIVSYSFFNMSINLFLNFLATDLRYILE